MFNCTAPPPTPSAARSLAFLIKHQLVESFFVEFLNPKEDPYRNFPTRSATTTRSEFPDSSRSRSAITIRSNFHAHSEE
jgi:hypothetical protein